jgi:NDP-sugar pyrophosphorylase family protein
MAPVVDTPIIRHIFDLLARHRVSEAYVNVHYLADASSRRTVRSHTRTA